MQITKITTREGESYQLGKLTVLVGPNNVGKSQALRDIRDGAGFSRQDKVLIHRVETAPYSSIDELLPDAMLVPWIRQGGLQYENFAFGLGPDLTSKLQIACSPSIIRTQITKGDNGSIGPGELRNLAIAYLDAESRLRVASDSPSHNSLESAPENLMQALFVDRGAAEQELRAIFRSAFEMDIRLDYSAMTSLCFRVAPRFPEVPDDPRKAFAILNGFPKLDSQGDGMRSFAGVVLAMLLCRGRIIMLDEPEGFLHPAQARRLGSWIARYSKSGQNQVIVATHNAHFLAGLLSQKVNLDICRLDRRDDKFLFQPISSEAVVNLGTSAVLSSQRVLEAFFNKGAAVCEADSDRIVYQQVSELRHDNHNIFFLHAHNKQTIPEVLNLLREAHIPCCGIADIDILNNSEDLSKIMSALNPQGSFEQYFTDRKTLAESVDARPESEILASAKEQLELLLEQVEKNEHKLSGIKGALNRVKASISKWDNVKKKGTEGFAIELQPVCESLLGEFSKIGLFVVPVGGLESWLDLDAHKGARWIALALTQLREGDCPAKLHNFVGQLLEYFGERTKPHPAETAQTATEVIHSV